ncbi:cytochrome c oxidase subunit 2A [Deinococcus lacus]|uniref:Cytochrome c oxidase subunit 2A n=1 Tax=Deinococcus lacus TaxID=392561 RepID=A0ABW1YH38_9DEIO
MSEHSRPRQEGTRQKAERPEDMKPYGTLAVVGLLTLAISFFWLLVLGVMQGRA